MTKQLTKQLTNLVQEFDAATEAARVSMKVDAEAKVAAVAAANDSLAKLEAFRAAQKALADAVNAVTMEGQSP